MNWNEVSIHTTPNSYPDSATPNDFYVTQADQRAENPRFLHQGETDYPPEPMFASVEPS